MTLALAPKENKEPGKFDPIILDFRNRSLAKRIVEDPHDKIFITYGANHLTGVLELLKQQDPNWKEGRHGEMDADDRGAEATHRRQARVAQQQLSRFLDACHLRLVRKFPTGIS